MNVTSNEHALVFPLTAGQPASLTIDRVTGDLHIEGWDQPSIAIETDDDDVGAELGDILNASQNGNEVSLNLSLPRSAHHKGHGRDDDPWSSLAGAGRLLRQLGRGLNVDLHVRVPRRCDITIRTASGDVELQGIQGKLYVQTAAGDVTIREVAGSALVKSASADVTVDKLRGRLAIRTMSGDLAVGNSEFVALSVGTVSGDVEVNAILHPNGEYDIQTVSGDVKLTLPANRRATVSMETVTGDLECALPHRRERRDRRHHRLEINGGGEVAVAVRTTSGDVQLAAGLPWNGGPAPAAGDAGATHTRRFSPDEAGAAQVSLGDAALVAQGESGEAGEPEAGQTQRLDARAEERDTRDAERGARPSPEMVILEAIESGAMTVDEGLHRLNELTQ